eukprot:GDKJ01042810.1.p1 GENE.GDKJ01042810.1~~GDKJ01042810.1.p1  ORF type:complete len:145 (-),score=14.57 GDKJ01042810.1:270-704(-)
MPQFGQELSAVLLLGFSFTSFALIIWTLNHVKDVHCDFYSTTKIRVSGWGIMGSYIVLKSMKDVKESLLISDLLTFLSTLSYLAFEYMFVITTFQDFDTIKLCSSTLYNAARPAAIFHLVTICILTIVALTNITRGFLGNYFFK